MRVTEVVEENFCRQTARADRLRFHCESLATRSDRVKILQNVISLSVRRKRMGHDDPQPIAAAKAIEFLQVAPIAAAVASAEHIVAFLQSVVVIVEANRRRRAIVDVYVVAGLSFGPVVCTHRTSIL